ncbi:MAG: hypothetical protein WA814_06560 [Candidatus Baltobacteraceae bacterium]
MRTQQLGISILAAPLASIDRRALSQAWYTALHLARAPQPSAIACRACVNGGSPLRAVSGAPARLVSRPLEPVRVRVFERREAAILAERDARGALRPSSTLARRIETTLFGTSARASRATFSVGEECARVHVMLASRGNTVTLIALCRPQMRDVVARALTQVRTALVARGIGIGLEMRGSFRCS